MSALDKSVGILVAGMHRSGTSAVAGLLAKIGVSLSTHLLEPGEDNPKGYWEHRRAVDINDRLLNALDRSWDDIRGLPKNWLESDPAHNARNEIKELIKEDFEAANVWAIKDPRMCRLLPIWIEALQDLGVEPVVLTVARNPLEVAASLTARNQMGQPIGLALWLRYFLEAEAASRKLRRVAILYDDFLSSPLTVISTALQELGVSISVPDAAARSELAGFVDPSDRHHSISRERSCNGSPLESLACETYASIVDIAHRSQEWTVLERSGSEFEAEWAKIGSLAESVANELARAKKRAEQAHAEWFRVRSDLNAQIEWSEQAAERMSSVRIECDEQRKAADEADRRYKDVLGENDLLQSKIGALQLEMGTLSQQLESLRHVQARYDEALGRLAQLHSSWSWRLTKPLRFLRRLSR